MLKLYRFYLVLFSSALLTLYGCSSSSSTEKEESEKNVTEEIATEEAQGAIILNVAKDEQQNEMYSSSHDSTYLYWLNNKLIFLHNQTKCNIYALNVLFKSGCKTPTVNALSRGLADTSKFSDILPVVGISEPETAKKGDLIVWNGHVIIFDYLYKIKNDLYAFAWWAGTRQKDNGDNIINNVVYGKYKLDGYFIIRRPLRKS